MTHALLLWNVVPAVLPALWLLRHRRYLATLVLLLATFALSYVWPLPPVPLLAALALALSLRRCLQLLIA